MERPAGGGQRDQPGGAVQFPLDVQRNALCFAAGGDGDDLFPPLGSQTAACRIARGAVPRSRIGSSLTALIASHFAAWSRDNARPALLHRCSVSRCA